MATSSITKNFVISGKRQVEMFADAIEASANGYTSFLGKKKESPQVLPRSQSSRVSGT